MKLTLTGTKEITFAASNLKPSDIAKLEVKDGNAYISFVAVGTGVTGRLKLQTSEVEGEGTFGLSHKVLKSLSRMNGNVELSDTEKQIKIKNYGTTYRFAKADFDFDVPELEKLDAVKAFSFESPFKTFKAALKVAKGFCDGSVKEIFNGLYFEVDNGTLDIVGTNGSYLAYFNITLNDGSQERVSFIVDKNITPILLNAIDLFGRGEIRVNPSSVIVTDGESYLIIPQLYGDYPDAKSIVVSPFVGENVDANFCKVKVLKEQLDNVAKSLRMVVEDDTTLPFTFELPTEEREYFKIKRAFFNDSEDAGYVETEMFYEDICEDYKDVVTDEKFPFEPLAKFISPFKSDAEFTLYLPRMNAPVLVEEGKLMMGLGFNGTSFEGLVVTMPLRK